MGLFLSTRESRARATREPRKILCRRLDCGVSHSRALVTVRCKAFWLAIEHVGRKRTNVKA